MLYAPLEYGMIKSAFGNTPPDADLIEHLSYSSKNPYFKTRLFRRHLINYRIHGCQVARIVKPPTAEVKLRALKLRRKQMYGI